MRLVGMVAALLFSTGATAAIRVDVNTTADEFGSGAACSLREALYAVNHAAAFGGCTLGSSFLVNAIYVPAGNYAITRSPMAGNPEAGGALKVNAAVGVYGAGAAATIVDGASIDRVFAVAPPAGTSVFMSGMTIRGGTSGVNNGAGIEHTSGTLTLQNVLVTENFGGYGIRSAEGEGLTLRQVTVSKHHNTGVYISNYAASSGVTLLENTTISGNAAPTSTGGIEIYAANNRTNSATISNSTIAYNTGRADGQNIRAPGGLAVYGDGATAYLRNTILARNFRGDRSGEDCDSYSATLNSQGYNLIEQAPYCVFQGNTATDLTGIDPLLAPLYDYGNGLPTHLLFPASPAVDAGNPANPGSGGTACASADARGLARTASRCDIGAYELYFDSIVNSTGDAATANPGTLTCTALDATPCTLRKAIQHANITSGFHTIRVPAGTYDLTIPRGNVQPDDSTGDLDLLGSGAVTLVGDGADKTIVRQTLSDDAFEILQPAVSLHAVTISSNGHGMFVTGSLLLDAVRVTGTAGGLDHAIFMFDCCASDLLMIGSTIDHNVPGSNEFGGGGLYVGSGSTATIINSTFAGNVAAHNGGAIYNHGGTVSIAFSTIAGNKALAAAANDIGGGGIARSNGAFFIGTSIIANNTDASGQAPDCAAIVQVTNYTALRDTAGCTLGGQSFKAMTATDPLLSPLLMQGGPLPTVAPLAASPVHYVLGQRKDCVDVFGDEVWTDGRGLPRPTSYNWGNPEYCDLGAFQGTSDVIFADGFD